MSGFTIIDEAVTIELTTNCNLNCSYCYLSEEARTAKYSAVEVGIKAMNHCRDIVRTMKRDGVILRSVMLLSAEPTVLNANHLAMCINILSERVEHIQIMTNGVRLADEDYYNSLFKLVKDVRVTIGVTIDGYKELHDAARDNSYDDAASTVARLYKDKRLERVNIVVGTEAIKDPERFKAWYKEFILDRGILHIASSVEPPVILSMQERMAIIKLLRDMTDMHGEAIDTDVDMCSNVHILLDRAIAQCTNDCATVSGKYINLDSDFKLLLASRQYYTKVMNEECKTCDKQDICNVHCHWHTAPNGFAFNCAYGRND